VASFGGYGNVSPYTVRAIGTTTLVSGVWYHIVGTYSENDDFFKIYVNGTLEDTETLDSNYVLYTSYNWQFGKNYYSNQGSCSGYCYLNGTIDNVQVWDTVYGNSQISGLYNYPLSGPVLYSTQHYGGSDDKTDSEGKLDELAITTKVYDGSSSGASVNPYIGLRYGDWTKPVKATIISDNEFEANILDFRVYNRNKEKLYYSFGSATGAASSANVIEVWPGKYKENVVINTRVTIIGSGQTRTIIDGRYLDSPIRINTNGDHTKIRNLQVTRSYNSTASCSSTTYGGISIYSASDVSIDNVLFFESYNGLMANKVNNLKVTNSIFDRGSSSGYYGVNICDDEYSNQDSLLFENNIVKKYVYGIHLSSLNQGIDIYNNYIHNNTQTGIYLNSVSYTSYQNNPLEIVGNRLVDNYYGFYKGDSSSSWGRNVLFKDNLVKSSSNYGVYCYYYCYDWIVENNTFDGDSDQSYGIYMRAGYRAKFGNNTFSDHTSYDIYLNTCGTGSNSNKFFYNTYSSIGITSSCQVDVYNNLNVKTVEQDSDPFSNVELEIKDSSKTYYETPHWGGSDSLTDSSGFISGTIFMRSGYYASSSTLTDNNITVNYAYGIRARSTWTTFDEDTTKSFTIPDEFRYGVVKNTNTSVLYTSFSSAISAASAGNVLDVWAWTYNENVEITKGVTLIGNSTATAIINGGTGDYSIEVKSNDVTIKYLTLNGASNSLLYAGN
ncbi:MAG: NosD domain-containing protein, partial [Anaerolineales bacterium]|nr:NosD domain-containing protein [Anaerolineales bacterium]